MKEDVAMTFEEIAKKSQSALKQALLSELRCVGYQTCTKKGFIYARGSLPVLLVAHLDTVHKEPVKAICYSSDGKIVMSPQGIGGDDRAGVFMILEIIKKHHCHVLFCEDEEIGGLGAYAFLKSNIKPDVNFIVELDRRGSNDAVFYECDNPAFTKHICGFGFKEEFGSFSDISIIAPYLGIAAVNISAGYYHEHTRYEYVDLEAIKKNIGRVGKMVSTRSVKFEYREAICFRKNGFSDRFNRDEFADFDLPSGKGVAAEIQRLKVAAGQFGVSDCEVDLLLYSGYDPDEIEMLFNYPQELRRAVHEVAQEGIYCE
jgi:hypothetical protein